MVFQQARWRWEFLGTAWSNKSDANLPEGDTKPPMKFVVQQLNIVFLQGSVFTQLHMQNLSDIPNKQKQYEKDQQFLQLSLSLITKYLLIYGFCTSCKLKLFLFLQNQQNNFRFTTCSKHINQQSIGFQIEA